MDHSIGPTVIIIGFTDYTPRITRKVLTTEKIEIWDKIFSIVMLFLI